MNNLAIVFPEKTLAERKKIAKKFYRNFIDTFIESIKMLSLSDAAFEKRCTGNFEMINQIAAQGRNIQLHCAHQMNWELGNWFFSKNISIPFIGVYRKIGNSIFNRLFLKIRGRYNSILISTREFKTRVHDIFKNQYSIALVADQNPSNLNKAYWLYLFGKKAPFVPGPEKGATKNNTVVFFANLEKKRRGYYHFQFKLVTENPAAMKPGELTRLYRDFLEETIHNGPFNYLWSHRRWKHTFDENNEIFKNNWIDTRE